MELKLREDPTVVHARALRSTAISTGAGRESSARRPESDPRRPGELLSVRQPGDLRARAAAGRATRGRVLQLDLDYSLFFLSNRIQF